MSYHKVNFSFSAIIATTRRLIFVVYNNQVRRSYQKVNICIACQLNEKISVRESPRRAWVLRFRLCQWYSNGLSKIEHTISLSVHLDRSISLASTSERALYRSQKRKFIPVRFMSSLIVCYIRKKTFNRLPCVCACASENRFRSDYTKQRFRSRPQPHFPSLIFLSLLLTLYSMNGSETVGINLMLLG